MYIYIQAYKQMCIYKLYTYEIVLLKVLKTNGIQKLYEPSIETH